MEVKNRASGSMDCWSLTSNTNIAMKSGQLDTAALFMPTCHGQLRQPLLSKFTSGETVAQARKQVGNRLGVCRGWSLPTNSGLICNFTTYAIPNPVKPKNYGSG